MNIMGDEEEALPCQITNWKAEGRSRDAVAFSARSFELMDGKEMCDLKTQPDPVPFVFLSPRSWSSCLSSSCPTVFPACTK